MKDFLANNVRFLSFYNRWLGGNRIRTTGSSNQLCMQGALLYRVTIYIRGDNNRVSIGTGSRLRDLKILIDGDDHQLEVGEQVRMRGKIKLEDHGNCIRIGKATTMEDAYLGAYDRKTRIEIGSDCMFAEHVGLRTGDMHSVLDAVAGRRINPSRDILIGDHVWLGRGVTVLKGVEIGPNAVIGTESLVTRSIPAGTLAVGRPARGIRQGITWDRDRLPCDSDFAPDDSD